MEVDADRSSDVDLAASWIRDGRQLSIVPLHARPSRASDMLGYLSVPWALLVILGVTALYSAMGYQSSRIPAVVRAVSAIVGFAPLALGGLVGVLIGYGFGPMLGLGWAFDQRTLVIDAAGLRLVDGASEQWAIHWTSIVSLEPIDQRIGRASGLALIGDRDAGTRVIPSSLLEGRVGGTGLIVDVVGLVATLHART